MKISEHAANTERLCGLRAEDIHKWIDGYFDRQSFEHFIEYGRSPEYDPYKHRQFRHCREALPEAIKEFSGKYRESDIECVFFSHVKDDYDGYIPGREDFINGRFKEKYHESENKHGIDESILTPAELEKYFSGRHNGNRGSGEKTRLPGRFVLRIVLPAAAAAALFIAAVFFFILPLFHDSLLAEKKEMLEEISSVAVSILDYYAGLEVSGELSGIQARTASINEIAKLRYGPDNNNYFWITDMQPVMIMHPWRPDLQGRKLSGYTDSMNRSGKHLFSESVKLVEQSGGGFLEYLWQLDESGSRIVPKLSRVQGFSPWGWIIGTGIYINDVEEEISRLTKQLVFVMLIISASLAVFLTYLTLQSLRIERGRRQAEAGMLEAKERYRALVEASNEGYLLLIGGHSIFSNPTFRRITGYSEEESSDPDFIHGLFPDKNVIENLETEKSGSAEFETTVKCRSGARLEVIVRKSRIFLTEENGVIISFQPLAAGKAGAAPIFTADEAQADPFILFDQLNECSNAAQTVRILNQLPLAVRNLVINGTSSAEIRFFIADIYRKGLRKISFIAENELGSPPCEYSFLSLGSSGRGELTLFSDQDNALVFRAENNAAAEASRLYFLNLASRICGLLNQAGFPYCPGGIMAVNPSYCLSLDEWKLKYREWIRQADNISMLDIHVFFDLACGWGADELVAELYDFIFAVIKVNPGFLIHFARNCLSYKAPKGLMGNLKTEVRDGAHVINLKEALIPLTNYARITALREGFTLASTSSRLERLNSLGILDDDSFSDLQFAFETLWKLRFSNQVFAHGELRKVNDDLEPSFLPDKSLSELKKAAAIIAAVQSRLSYDFLGVDLS